MKRFSVHFLLSTVFATGVMAGAAATEAESITPLTILPAIEWTDHAPTTPIETIVVSAARLCDEGVLEKIEQMNDRVKPIKEIVGYIRSPQGLAVKLVNDHIVKIPAWVGYALDPVGSLKNKAVGEVRNQVKTLVRGASAQHEACQRSAAPETSTDVMTPANS
jgi:hypothetical protein